MRAEEEVRKVMRMPLGIEKKSDKIREFMDWNRGLLIKAMKEFGTFGTHNRGKVIKVFWPDKQ